MCFLLLFSALLKTDQSGPLVNTSDDVLKLILKMIWVEGFISWNKDLMHDLSKITTTKYFLEL